MSKVESKENKTNYYLAILVLFILGDILCDNYIVRAFNRETYWRENVLSSSLLILQIFFAPVQAALSDLYCRKKSLVVSLSFSFVSLLFVFIYNQISTSYLLFPLIILLTKGIAGNTIPLSWSAIADTQRKNLRFSFGLSTTSYAFGYLFLVFANKILSEKYANIFSMLLFIAFIYICIMFFQDLRDKKKEIHAIDHSEKSLNRIWFSLKLFVKENKLVASDIKANWLRNALISFLLWEVSLYSILLLYIDFNVKEFSAIAIAMQLGYLTGVFALKFLTRQSDQKIIKIGYWFSSWSLVPFFLILPFSDISSSLGHFILIPCYFLHTFGNGFLSPTMLTLLTKERPPHERGRILGLLASADTIAFLLAHIIVAFYNFHQFNLLFIIFVSYLTVTVSWWPYARFEKYKPAKLH